MRRIGFSEYSLLAQVNPTAQSKLNGDGRRRLGRGLTLDFMYIRELVGRIIVNLIKQAWLLPQTMTRNHQQQRRQITRQRSEAERLDRIRQPWKYLGKS